MSVFVSAPAWRWMEGWMDVCEHQIKAIERTHKIEQQTFMQTHTHVHAHRYTTGTTCTRTHAQLYHHTDAQSTRTHARTSSLSMFIAHSFAHTQIHIHAISNPPTSQNASLWEHIMYTRKRAKTILSHRISMVCFNSTQPAAYTHILHLRKFTWPLLLIAMYTFELLELSFFRFVLSLHMPFLFSCCCQPMFRKYAVFPYFFLDFHLHTHTFWVHFSFKFKQNWREKALAQPRTFFTLGLRYRNVCVWHACVCMFAYFYFRWSSDSIPFFKLFCRSKYMLLLLPTVDVTISLGLVTNCSKLALIALYVFVYHFFVRQFLRSLHWRIHFLWYTSCSQSIFTKLEILHNWVQVIFRGKKEEKIGEQFFYFSVYWNERKCVNEIENFEGIFSICFTFPADVCGPSGGLWCGCCCCCACECCDCIFAVFVLYSVSYWPFPFSFLFQCRTQHRTFRFETFPLIRSFFICIRYRLM